MRNLTRTPTNPSPHIARHANSHFKITTAGQPAPGATALYQRPTKLRKRINALHEETPGIRPRTEDGGDFPPARDPRSVN